MKNFKEYITEKEELEFKQRLDEDLMVASTVLGYATAGALIAWAGSLVVKGSVSLFKATVKALTKAWSYLFGERPKSTKVINTVKDIKKSQPVKVAVDKAKTERSDYEEKLDSVFKAIEEKDSDKAFDAFKETGVRQTPVVNRVIIGEVTEVLGEPPIHYGNTGNEAYKFIKKVLGIKVAQSAAAAVKEALKDKSSELISNVEKE